ncbi:energy-coupling factor transporter transmembrane component T family protein [Thermaerobacter subterraneus]|uniref:ABC-type cobalt transport system, permease component CbiQ n=1 Tax=Thermaerobacter subterraneus DSM 13965 TaxID=867903 RepID=K6Q1M3_9FIRM|nr:energy-coupling factor transporter transmembrane protein EcfT [Thermaerobacter subterraneus]EKP94879.1 ABC-type cobalt transport system, permease component CbiQ [Thermaerobacter subterraneus DSM 13965]
MIPEPLVGQYVPGESLVHRLDPRTKIALLAGYTVVLFLVREWAAYGLLAALVLAGTLVAGLPLAYLVAGLRPMAWLAALTLVLNLVAVPGDPLVHLGPLVATRQGLELGLRLAVRLLLLVAAASLLTLTTSPIALTDGLEALLRRLGRRVPAHELAMMMTIALRFIPTLAEEADRIMKAQLARGARFHRGGPVQRLRALVPLLVPLFVSAFRRADDLALAMEARGYRGGAGRTRYRELRPGRADAMAVALATVLFGMTLWWGR